ncbi:MAG: MBL fold metallo-hydrolase [Pseudomonadales bacterium]|nr:MBL fold metallo-hydrolase [Pseudomonadales bacterium]
MRQIAFGLLCMGLVACGTAPSPGSPTNNAANDALQEILDTAARIPGGDGWFEILRLPNRVYALWEPGHVEAVNAYFVLGSERDLLYDTGMGIASAAAALAAIRRAESLPEKPLMVVNSHNHLDHNGGNRDFAEIFTADDDWARRRLSLGVPAGDFTAYWDQLREHPGVQPPAGFDPATHAIAPYPLEQVRYLAEGDRVDLGDRQFTVIRTFSHSPDGIALYDATNQVFFGGDTFYGPDYLVTDMALLAADLERTRSLPVRWHYASHGAQLTTAMQHGNHLVAVRRMLAGEGTDTTQVFAGVELPVRELDGVTVTLAADLLLY